MQKSILGYYILACLLLTAPCLWAQDSIQPSVVSAQYVDKVNAKAGKLEEQLDRKSDKAIKRMQKQEANMRRRLMKIDSLAANNIFGDADAKYKQLEQQLSAGKTSQYIPSLDTLSSSLKFLQQNPAFLSQAKDTKQKLDAALLKVGDLKDKFRSAEEVKKFLRERKQFLKDQLGRFGFAKELKKMNKQVYYYSQQLNEYKEALKDSRKAERKAIDLLSKTKPFKDFIRKNGDMAAMFGLSGGSYDPNAQPVFAGLQTRAQVSNLIQGQIASGGSNARQQFQQNMQAGQSQLNELKNKLRDLGGAGTGGEMPEGFRPNNQKTKSFWQRWELGINLQNQRSSSLLPHTSDIGLSAGYKLNDRSIIGVGGSVKLGWGKNIQHIKLSGQGASARSFIDWKLKGSFWMSGGFEMNYHNEFRHIAALQNYSAWQRSGLIGVSKTVALSSKILKKTKVQLLWDFLSYDVRPRSQPIIFRLGYSF